MSTIPRHVTAVLSGLRLRCADRELLQIFDDNEWRRLLAFTDRMHLTLPLGEVCRDYLPHWVRSRIEKNLSDNSARFAAIKAMYIEIAERFQSEGIEHLVLKGFAQSAACKLDPRLRFQSDLDLFCLEGSAARAQNALLELGYGPLDWAAHFQSDQHLTALVRATDWQWRGDWFDPEMPVSVELHTRFWNESTSRFGPKRLDEFWPRRGMTQLEDLEFPTLHPVDALGYSCLHALRHVLYGSLLTHHIYELAWLLHLHSADASFWKLWRESHDDSMKSLEAICFQLASAWFGCKLSDDAQEAIMRLPLRVRLWLDEHGDSPLYTAFQPNKDALWLHLSLIESGRDRTVFFLRSVILRRIPVRGLLEPRTRRIMANRAVYHGRLFFSTLWKGMRWWWSRRNLGRQY